MIKRLKAADRRAQIIEEGLRIAKTHGLHHVTHDRIASNIGISKTAVIHCLHKKELLKKIINRAIETQETEVLLQASALKLL